jgi:small subunit ribosomal protein S4
LDLTIEDVLERRLQTIVFRKGLTKTIHQARQLITHGHITIGKKRITVPSYIVAKAEESQMTYTPQSPFAISSHPLRQTVSNVATTERPSEEARTREER